jgi:hypothetical protein
MYFVSVLIFTGVVSSSLPDANWTVVYQVETHVKSWTRTLRSPGRSHRLRRVLWHPVATAGEADKWMENTSISIWNDVIRVVE